MPSEIGVQSLFGKQRLSSRTSVWHHWLSIVYGCYRSPLPASWTNCCATRHVCSVPSTIFCLRLKISHFQPFPSRLSVVPVKWVVLLLDTLIAFVTYLLALSPIYNICRPYSIFKGLFCLCYWFSYRSKSAHNESCCSTLSATVWIVLWFQRMSTVV